MPLNSGAPIQPKRREKLQPVSTANVITDGRPTTSYDHQSWENNGRRGGVQVGSIRSRCGLNTSNSAQNSSSGFGADEESTNQKLF